MLIFGQVMGQNCPQNINYSIYGDTFFQWTLLDVINGEIQINVAYNSAQLNYDIPYRVQLCPEMSSEKL